MSNIPRVTIVTPSFNQVDFLEETIRSVLSQDYPNLEYFIIDGGSMDGSVELIQRYANRLAGWLSEKDRGQADAINKGFSRATGEIVAWLNSDDLYQPGAIHAAVSVLQAHPEYGMAYGDVVSINGTGEPFNVMRFSDWGLDGLMQFNIISQPGVFMRREALEQAGPLDLSYHYLLDHHLWLRLAQNASIHYVPDTWAAARFHATAKNVAQASGFGREAIRLAEWMAGQPGLADRYRRLRRQIWAGAYRMDGRYLLDADEPGPALRSYLRSLWFYPPVALPETRRMLYAFASLFMNVSSVKQRYLEQRKAKLKIS